MMIFYKLGQITGKFLRFFNGLNPLVKLASVYFVLSHVTLYKQDFEDLAAYLSIALSFLISGLIYYRMFELAKSTIKSILK